MPFYTAYGLNIQSELELPELIPGGDGSDITIRLGQLEHPLNADAIEGCLEATPDHVYLYWPDVGTFLVAGGREITIDPTPGTAENTLRLFTLGSGFGVLLQQRGLLVLHASAVAVAGAVVAFIGDKGWGKSTTAASLHARGHTLVTDDLLAITFAADGQPLVLPAYPQFKLWPESVEALGIAPEDLPLIRPELDKRARRISENFAQEALPLRALYVLGGGDELLITPLAPQTGFIHLLRHVYVSRFGTDFLKQTGANQHFFHCTAITRRLPVRAFIRRNDLTQLQAAIDLVEADFAQVIAADQSLPTP